MPGFKGRGQPSSEELSSIALFIHAINSCDNQVIADRISIFANACDFRYRLQSNRSDRSDISYAICLIVLTSANPALILTILFRIKQLSYEQTSDTELWRFFRIESRSAKNRKLSSGEIESAYSYIVLGIYRLENLGQARYPDQHLEEHFGPNAQQGKQPHDLPQGRRQHALYHLYRRLAQLFEDHLKRSMRCNTSVTAVLLSHIFVEPVLDVDHHVLTTKRCCF
jgi:hypothetical protein